MSKRYPRWTNLDFLEFCHPRILALYQYWNSKRGNRLMPSRADIDPLDFPTYLPGIVMVDVYYLRRYAPTLTSAHLVDCNERRSASMPNEPDFAEDGMPLNLEWRDGTVDTALVEALCA